MELRHLRYFVAVAEAMNFTRAAARLRVAQPALSRQVQDLEDEIGVDLLKRSPRGVTLTAEGRLYLEEAREILKRSEEAVEKVRALARGEYGELQVGYAPAPSSSFLPQALTAFHKAAPGVQVTLHDLTEDDMVARLVEGTLELAITVEHPEQSSPGIEFEELLRVPFLVAMSPGHALAKKKALKLEEIAAQPLIGFHRRDYPEYHRLLGRMFPKMKQGPRLIQECDGSISLLTALEAGRAIAVVSAQFRHVAGKRLVFKPIADCNESHAVGIARAMKGDVTPAGEKFCEILRAVAR
ncbi:MAG: LysR family transcriptional regulator [Luteolibacter sp.]